MSFPSTICICLLLLSLLDHILAQKASGKPLEKIDLEQQQQPQHSPVAPEQVPLNNLTLHYFKFRGRGEPIRLLLHYTAIPFVDHRIGTDQWLGADGFKNRTPFGHVPLIRLVDGREMAESFAIMRMIARQNGLAGNDPWESAKIDEFADFHKDAFSAFHDALSLTEQQIEEESPESRANLQRLLGQFMPIYQRQLRSSPNPGFLFANLSWPDFLVADFVESFEAIRPGVLAADFPEMLELRQKVYGLDPLKEYLASRKFSRF